MLHRKAVVLNKHSSFRRSAALMAEELTQVGGWRGVCVCVCAQGARVACRLRRHDCPSHLPLLSGLFAFPFLAPEQSSKLLVGRAGLVAGRLVVWVILEVAAVADQPATEV